MNHQFGQCCCNGVFCAHIGSSSRISLMFSIFYYHSVQVKVCNSMHLQITNLCFQIPTSMHLNAFASHYKKTPNNYAPALPWANVCLLSEMAICPSPSPSQELLTFISLPPLGSVRRNYLRDTNLQQKLGMNSFNEELLCYMKLMPVT